MRLKSARVLQATVWLVPLCTAVLVAALYSTSLDLDSLKKRIQALYGVSEDQLAGLSLEMPGGWKIPANAVLQRPEHHHPLPPKYAVASTGTAMIFAHIGNGTIEGTARFFQTLFVLLNDSNRDVSGTLELYDNDGKPLTLTINGVSGSSFPFTIKSGQSQRFTTSGTGPVQQGWAHVHSDQPLAGTASFGITDAEKRVYTDVGVAESSLGTNFTLFADTLGNANTGIAGVNPSDTDTITLLFQLLNAAGVVVATDQRQLGPRAHVAFFLDELFKSVSGITEFEGTVLITSAKPFAGITLRSLGDQLTSLPMVPPAPAGSARDRLIFPHVADGVAGGFKIATSAILFNNTTERATGKVEFINSDGTPMSVTIGGQTASSFDFALNPKAVRRLVTSGASGAAKVGWARVIMDKPMSGTAIFHLFDTSDRLLSEVGVNAAVLRKNFNIIADTLGFFNTGIATANPSEENLTSNVNFYLYDKNGTFVSAANRSLKALEKQAFFLTDLFPNVPGIAEFDGRLNIIGSEFVAPLALRQVNEKTTSTPTLARLYGFAPTSTFTPLELAAGTSPAVEWLIHQNERDLSLEKIKITAPDLGLQTSEVSVGRQIAQGYFALGTNSRIFVLYATAKGSIDFNFIVPAKNSFSTAGTGKITGTPTGGLTIEMTLTGKSPMTYVGDDSDFHFFLNPGIIVAPASGKQVTVTTELTSVSYKSQEDVRVVRRATEQLNFTTVDSSKAVLSRIAPLFPGPGGILELTGSNFGNSPVAVFTPKGGSPVQVTPFSSAAGTMSVTVPDGFSEGAIQVNNGGGVGNSHSARSLFSPTFSFETASRTGGAETAFSFTIKQPVEQFVLQDFSVTLFQIERALSGLAAGTVVGGGKMQQSSTVEFDLKVESSAADKLVLQVVQKGLSSPRANLNIEKLPGDAPGILMTYVPSSTPSAPVLLDSPLEFTFNFTGFPLKLPSAGNLFLAGASLRSGPTDPRSSEVLDVSRVVQVNTQ
ncbi:MAG: hypothetical protein HY645_10205 [Acidobacteria bacterium]|nr:hypothetical protein [Acidobacteriota bacterium]